MFSFGDGHAGKDGGSEWRIIAGFLEEAGLNEVVAGLLIVISFFPLSVANQRHIAG